MTWVIRQMTDQWISWFIDPAIDQPIHWLIGSTHRCIDPVTHWLTHRLSHWLMDPVFHWLTDHLSDWVSDSLIGCRWLIEWLTEWFICIHLTLQNLITSNLVKWKLRMELYTLEPNCWNITMQILNWSAIYRLNHLKLKYLVATTFSGIETPLELHHMELTICNLTWT